MKSTTSKLRLICAFSMRAMFALLTAIFVLAIGARAENVYNYTGAVQTFTVPAGVTSISVDAYGASGMTDGRGDEGKGGRVQAILTVTPGEVLHIYVGGSKTLSAELTQIKVSVVSGAFDAGSTQILYM